MSVLNKEPLPEPPKEDKCKFCSAPMKKSYSVVEEGNVHVTWWRCVRCRWQRRTLGRPPTIT